MNTKPPAHVGTRIKEAREQKDWSQNDLGRKAGVDPGTISRAERGETEPNPSTLDAIADAIGIAREWLRTGQGKMARPKEMEVEGSQGDAEGYLPILSLGTSPTNGHHRVDEREIGHLTPDEETPFIELRRAGKTVYYIPIRGNSMYPTLRRGVLVPVQRYDPTREDIPEDGIYVFRYHDAISVKRLQILSARRLKVISDNERYDDREIELGEGVDFEVLGQVLV